MGKAKTIALVKTPQFLFVASLLTLTGCGKPLDTAKIAETIQDDIIKQGGLSLKSVVCPDGVKPESGQTFECVGILDTDGGFAIPVTQQDDQGTVRWSVPSVKGLVNVSELQTKIQQELEKELGPLTINCGNNIYRAVKPGESFECKVLKRGAKPIAKLTEKTAEKSLQTNNRQTKQAAQNQQPGIILVTIDPAGGVNWQRVLPGANPKGGSLASGQSASAKTNSASSKPGQTLKKPKVTTENIPDPNRPGDGEVLVD
ncbi:DUF4333 domain-containing protein [Leptothermofonsia sp. ETS-13]|uniref:DUF4333 domain-containing protein n=1 Tax=Leptothermofonsia sp. ETS-13 TaxID=3035696 RepID=UPI003B9F60AC